MLVLYAGNIGEKQGLDVVIDAAEQLRERAWIKFVIIGVGAAQERLERATRKRELDNVRFFPLQPLERLPLVLAAGDVHLVGQRREAADLVMLSKLTKFWPQEGRAWPQPSRAQPCTTFVLTEYDCGITAAPGDVKELAAGIAALTGDARMRERLGRNARRYAEAYLDKDKILTEFESRLRQLVKEGA